ncbi:Nin one binding Zn-ribbon like-domain-containing protein [Scheffersomyces xylosifermentans]|uniref:Nin one binding Zn-ribbon like-domain-containing protein n=1 Tax=Scheffersomyces xylosifermentans TaxID=1304137 RepID=UPI00315D58C0
MADIVTIATPKIKALVLDAAPLITQSASALQQHGHVFYTTPGVHSELKDEHARQQLILWADRLQIRHPKPESIQKVSSFAKLTGDYAVLSVNDIHIIALAYELECELNNGDWRLRKYPGEKLEYKKKSAVTKPETETVDKNETEPDATVQENNEKTEEIKVDNTEEPKKEKKPRRRGGKRQREKREAELQRQLEQESEDQESSEDVKPEQTVDASKEAVESVQTEEVASVPEAKNEELDENYEEDDDDGEWITPENLMEEIMKDASEQIQESKSTGKSEPFIKVAISTGDFACQNVAMQIGLNLMNPSSGKQIKRVRNYMYRCHACFRLTPIPKNGAPKHFCPKCGGATLLRCAVSVDNITGKVTPHLKSNFQWYKRGERYTLPSPLSKNQQKIAGNGGYQHNKENRHKSLQTPLILREDQKEYQQALKDDEWQRRQQEKMLEEWIGGGSADNFISPFSTMNNTRHSAVKVGRGRFVNSSKGKKK